MTGGLFTSSTKSMVKALLKNKWDVKVICLDLSHFNRESGFNIKWKHDVLLTMRLHHNTRIYVKPYEHHYVAMKWGTQPLATIISHRLSSFLCIRSVFRNASAWPIKTSMAFEEGSSSFTYQTNGGLLQVKIPQLKCQLGPTENIFSVARFQRRASVETVPWSCNDIRKRGVLVMQSLLQLAFGVFFKKKKKKERKIPLMHQFRISSLSGKCISPR